MGRDMLYEETPWTLTLRRGDWKYVKPVNADFRLPSWAQDKDFEPGVTASPQLYIPKSDPGERNDIAARHPDIVSELEERLAIIVNRRSRVVSP